MSTDTSSVAADPASGKAGKPQHHPQAQCLVHASDINDNDVLSGRGCKLTKGNIAFRDLVSAHSEEYSVARRQQKKVIAQRMINEVVSRGGRFLVAFKDSEGGGRTGAARSAPPGQPIWKGAEWWKVAEDDVAMEKAKQSLRDTAAASKPAKAKASGGSMKSTSKKNKNKREPSPAVLSAETVQQESAPLPAKLSGNSNGTKSDMSSSTSINGGQQQAPQHEVESYQHIYRQQIPGFITTTSVTTTTTTTTTMTTTGALADPAPQAQDFQTIFTWLCKDEKLESNNPATSSTNTPAVDPLAATPALPVPNATGVVSSLRAPSSLAAAPSTSATSAPSSLSTVTARAELSRGPSDANAASTQLSEVSATFNNASSQSINGGLSRSSTTAAPPGVGHDSDFATVLDWLREDKQVDDIISEIESECHDDCGSSGYRSESSSSASFSSPSSASASTSRRKDGALPAAAAAVGVGAQHSSPLHPIAEGVAMGPSISAISIGAVDPTTKDIEDIISEVESAIDGSSSSGYQSEPSSSLTSLQLLSRLTDGGQGASGALSAAVANPSIQNVPQESLASFHGSLQVPPVMQPILPPEQLQLQLQKVPIALPRQQQQVPIALPQQQTQQQVLIDPTLFQQTIQQPSVSLQQAQPPMQSPVLFAQQQMQKSQMCANPNETSTRQGAAKRPRYEEPTTTEDRLAPLYNWGTELDEVKQNYLEYSLPVTLPFLSWLLGYSRAGIWFCVFTVVFHTLEASLTNFGPRTKSLRFSFAPLAPVTHMFIDCFIIWTHSLVYTLFPHHFGPHPYWLSFCIFNTVPYYMASSYKTHVLKIKRAKQQQREEEEEKISKEGELTPDTLSSSSSSSPPALIEETISISFDSKAGKLKAA